MKRNWKLIRAILIDQISESWTWDEVRDHLLLCHEAGYTHNVLRGECGGKMDAVVIGPRRLTLDGEEAAAALRNEADLDAVLRAADMAGVGLPSDVLFELLAERSTIRLRAANRLGAKTFDP